MLIQQEDSNALNCSFVLPVRIDCKTREENLLAVLRFLRTVYPKEQCIVVEHSARPQARALIQSTDVQYRHIASDGPFAKTHAINLALDMCETSCLIVYDVDMLIQPQALKDAKSLLTGKTKAVLPYNRVVINLKGLVRQAVLTGSYDIVYQSSLEHQFNKQIASDRSTFEYCAIGGICLFDVESLKKVGGFNKKIIGYGYEDTEIITRLNKLNYEFTSLPNYNAFHLDHERNPNLLFGSSYTTNCLEWEKVSKMSPMQIEQYITTDLLGYK